MCILHSPLQRSYLKEESLLADVEVKGQNLPRLILSEKYHESSFCSPDDVLQTVAQWRAFRTARQVTTQTLCTAPPCSTHATLLPVTASVAPLAACVSLPAPGAASSRPATSWVRSCVFFLITMLNALYRFYFP